MTIASVPDTFQFVLSSDDHAAEIFEYLATAVKGMPAQR